MHTHSRLEKVSHLNGQIIQALIWAKLLSLPTIKKHRNGSALLGRLGNNLFPICISQVSSFRTVIRLFKYLPQTSEKAKNIIGFSTCDCRFTQSAYKTWLCGIWNHKNGCTTAAASSVSSNRKDQWKYREECQDRGSIKCYFPAIFTPCLENWSSGTF